MDLLDLTIILELQKDTNFTNFLNNENYLEFYSLLQNEAQYKTVLDPISLEEKFIEPFIDFKLIADLIVPIYKEEIKLTIESLINIVFPSLEKIFVYENGSCYYYDSSIELYVYEKKYASTLMRLIVFIKLFKKRLEKMLPMFSETLQKIFKNIETLISYSDIKKIGTLIKREHEVKFNNKPYEIAYKKKILCLKTGKKRSRTRFDYYNETIEYSYYPDYCSVPTYITSVFGNEISVLDKIQKLLGSCIIGEPIDNVILFYGSGPNSKTTLINELSKVLKSFQANLDYSVLKAEDLKNKEEFNQKRLVTLDNLDNKGFADIEYNINRLLSNRNFNFIGVIDNEVFLKTPKLLLKKHALIEFNFSFLQNPRGTLERKKNKNLNVNKNFLFTWLCKGAMKYNYEQAFENKIHFNYEEEDEEDIYSSSEKIFDPDKEYVDYTEDVKKKTKCQTIYIGSGMLQQKRSYYKIGKTKQDMEKRLRVYQTGRDIEDRFLCLAHFPCYDCDIVEAEIKKILNQIDPNHFNEVYKINYSIIYSIVKELVEKYNKKYEEAY